MSSEGSVELEHVIATACETAEVQLVDVELRPGTLLVTVERPDGLDLDRVALTSRAISEALDKHDDLAPKGRYELEVTSPGLERRLRRPEHFEAVIGARVTIRTVPGTPGERRVSGLLVSANLESIEIAMDEGQKQRFSYNEIDRAHTVVDWDAVLRGSKLRKERPVVAQ